MCFSASASFTAGAIITAAGVATEVVAHKPSQRLFASIPFFFGIQQIAEGCVWISLTNPGHLMMQNVCTYIFLIIADLVWPVVIPASCLLMEENPRKRKIFKGLLIGGILLALYYAFCLIFFETKPEILNCHINYAGDYPKLLVVPAFLVYLAVTITPLVMSSIKGMLWLGFMLFIGVIVSLIFYLENVTSVWCFFGAIISIMIFWVLKKTKTETIHS